MASDKTGWALKVLGAEARITMPGYIADAVA
jgi:hypothetical protein